MLITIGQILLTIFVGIPVLLFIGAILHSYFYTGVIYKKKNNKPDRTWL